LAGIEALFTGLLQKGKQRTGAIDPGIRKVEEKTVVHVVPRGDSLVKLSRHGYGLKTRPKLSKPDRRYQISEGISDIIFENVFGPLFRYYRQSCEALFEKMTGIGDPCRLNYLFS